MAKLFAILVALFDQKGGGEATTQRVDIDYVY